MILKRKKYLKLFFTSILMFSLNNLTASTFFQENIQDSIQKYTHNNPLKAKKFTYTFLRKNEKNNNQANIILAFNYLGLINNILSHLDSAYYFYDKAIIRAYSINNEDLILDSKIRKANFLYQNYDFNNALSLFDEALFLANKLKNKKRQATINIAIARLKYEIAHYDEALKVFKNDYSEYIPPDGLVILDLYKAKTYLKIKQPDSSLYYLKKGLNFCIDNNDKELEIHFLNELGIYLTSIKKFTEADSVLHAAKIKATQINSPLTKYMVMLTASKLSIAEGDIEQSIQTLTNILEKKDEIKFTPEELSEYYELLAKNYKKIDSNKQSNYYYQKYIDVENEKNEKKFNTIHDLHEFDLKKVNKVKDSYFKQKQNLLVLVFILLGAFIIYFIINRKKQKNEELKFNSLMEKIKQFEERKIKNNFVEKEQANENLIEKNSLRKVINPVEGEEINETDVSENQFVIKNDTVTEILENLEKLEKKKYYLRQDFTLHSAAKKLKTNTAYLSKIINNELDKNFSTYLNELRINHAIIELKNNSKLRAYSVSAIAEEIGYKRAEPFTKYFKAATGLTPAVYIKKIESLSTKSLS